MTMARELAPCRCGCGVLTAVSPRNWPNKGICKGDPQYLPGHHNRVHMEYDPVAQTKVCTRCPERGHQPLDNFHLKAKSPDGHVFVCKRCRSEESKLRYANRSEDQKLRETEYLRRRVANHQRIVKERLSSGCVDCGTKDIRVLEFDHVRGEKIENISRLIRSGSEELLLAELDKCEVVCANDHRIRTSSRAGWWKELE